MSDIIGGNSSIELSRSSKGEYSYTLKVYFSGNTVSVIKGMIDRIESVSKYLEKKISKDAINEES